MRAALNLSAHFLESLSLISIVESTTVSHSIQMVMFIVGVHLLNNTTKVSLDTVTANPKKSLNASKPLKTLESSRLRVVGTTLWLLQVKMNYLLLVQEHTVNVATAKLKKQQGQEELNYNHLKVMMIKIWMKSLKLDLRLRLSHVVEDTI